ncbi:MAG: hypothetical protein ACI8S3_000207 [Alphaproteobacteria bacterium]|jgi:hypothetical protein
MPGRTNTESSDTPQMAAANPAADVSGADSAETAPVSPGLGPVVAQPASGGIAPDLTLLDLEALLNLDPTGDTRPVARSLEAEPLQTALENGELPADLTSLDLTQLLGLGLSGDHLPTLFEVSELPVQNQNSEIAETFGGDEEETALPEQAQAADQADTGGAPDGANPAAGPLLDDENDDDDDAFGSVDDFGLAAPLGDNAAVLGIFDSGPPTVNPAGNESQGNGGQGGSGSGGDNAPANIPANSGSSNGQENGPGSNNGHSAGSQGNNGQGNNADVDAASNSNAGGNPGNGASAIVLASISVPGGGDLPVAVAPADIVPADVVGPVVQTPAPAFTPASAAGVALPSNAASTFVSSSHPTDGPGNSAFGLSHGSPFGNASTGDDFTSNNVAPDAGGSSAPIEVPQVVPVNGGGGGGDMVVGTPGDDDLRGLGGDDTIDGLAGDDTINGGGGDDTLVGGAGADDLSGGGGADVLVWDFADLNIDGGGNTDTLSVEGSDDADITTFGGSITDIEVIDLASNGGDNAVTLTYADVLSMTDNADTLTVDGNFGDSLDAGTGWADGGVLAGYHTYTQGSGPNSATLVVDTDVTVNANILV